MKRQLAYYGDPILRKKCEDVERIDDDVRRLINDMVDTLIEHNGIGLAAPQVHQPLRIFITAVPQEQADGNWSPGKLRVFINPKILHVSEKKEMRSEGCLSIPKVYAEVERPAKVQIQATDLDGNLFEEEFSGLPGRCILHENDHINGVLFIDRVSKKDRRKLDRRLQELAKKLT